MNEKKKKLVIKMINNSKNVMDAEDLARDYTKEGIENARNNAMISFFDIEDKIIEYREELVKDVIRDLFPEANYLEGFIEETFDMFLSEFTTEVMEKSQADITLSEFKIAIINVCDEAGYIARFK